jgi:hypothetical protein
MAGARESRNSFLVSARRLKKMPTLVSLSGPYRAKRHTKSNVQTLRRSAMTDSQHVYEVRPRKHHRAVDLISDALPFGRLWYPEPNAVAVRAGKVLLRSQENCALTTAAIVCVAKNLARVGAALQVNSIF